MKRSRLTNLQIWLLLFIEKHCSLTGRMMLKPKHRELVVPLWRRDLVEIWWRQPPEGNRPRGPYFSLTADGFQLANAILAARAERASKRRAQFKPQPSALAA